MEFHGIRKFKEGGSYLGVKIRFNQAGQLAGLFSLREPFVRRNYCGYTLLQIDLRETGYGR